LKHKFGVKKKQGCTLSYHWRRERRYYCNINLFFRHSLTHTLPKPAWESFCTRYSGAWPELNNCLSLWTVKKEWLVGQNLVSLHFMGR